MSRDTEIAYVIERSEFMEGIKFTEAELRDLADAGRELVDRGCRGRDLESALLVKADLVIAERRR